MHINKNQIAYSFIIGESQVQYLYIKDLNISLYIYMVIFFINSFLIKFSLTFH